MLNKNFEEVNKAILTRLIEQTTNIKIKLVENTQTSLNEVKRKKMTRPNEVARYVVSLLKKHNIKDQVRITMSNNIVKVENKEKKYDVMALKSIAAELVEEGFNYGADRKLGDKNFTQLVDKEYSLVVFLPSFKKTITKK